jgi:hypothetical protein
MFSLIFCMTISILIYAAFFCLQFRSTTSNADIYIDFDTHWFIISSVGSIFMDENWFEWMRRIESTKSNGEKKFCFIFLPCPIFYFLPFRSFHSSTWTSHFVTEFPSVFFFEIWWRYFSSTFHLFLLYFLILFCYHPIPQSIAGSTRSLIFSRVPTKKVYSCTQISSICTK